MIVQKSRIQHALFPPKRLHLSPGNEDAVLWLDGSTQNQIMNSKHHT